MKKFIWLLPYFISGFSAPFIFKHAPSPVMGGHYAGSLFIFAGLWSVYLAFKVQMPLYVKGAFAFVLILQIIFWLWRFTVTTPLRESFLLGLSGSVWHGVMTGLYLFVALLLFIFSRY